MSNTIGALRVALVAGTLGQGGAEKQLVYMARALKDMGAQVSIFALTRGEYYERELCRLGIKPVWIGRYASPVLRVASLLRQVYLFRPHILQSGHFFTNLYVAVVGRLLRCLDIGALRSDVLHEMSYNRFFGGALLRWPRALIVNSYCAKGNAVAMHVSERRLHVLPNVVDIAQFDSESAPDCPDTTSGSIRVAVVGSLSGVKRIDRFLRSIAIAREAAPEVRGIIIGDGPELVPLQNLAGKLGLVPGGVQFCGRRDDVPMLLRSMDMLVISSDHEGFPNVVLEAMAARLPVIATPAGDCARVVVNGITGYVVPFDERSIADRIVELARSPSLRSTMGLEGRRRVELCYSYESLGIRLLRIYKRIAEGLGAQSVINVLSALDVGGRS